MSVIHNQTDAAFDMLAQRASGPVMKYRESGLAPKDRKGRWMQTASGRAYWPLDPRPEDIIVEDVAHHLGMMVRYTGACLEFYSIGEHSVLVSHIVQKDPLVIAAAQRSDNPARYLQRIGFQGLMHDGPEFALNDMNKPTKEDLPDYLALEDLNWRVFAPRFGLPLELDPAVKRADNSICLTEKAHIMAPSPYSWEDWDFGEPADTPIYCWDWRTAKRKFLERYAELTAPIAVAT